MMYKIFFNNGESFLIEAYDIANAAKKAKDEYNVMSISSCPEDSNKYRVILKNGNVYTLYGDDMIKVLEGLTIIKIEEYSNTFFEGTVTWIDFSNKVKSPNGSWA